MGKCLNEIEKCKKKSSILVKQNNFPYNRTNMSKPSYSIYEKVKEKY